MRYQSVNIETVQVGDYVEGKGEVVDVLNRSHARFIRLIFIRGNVVEGYYGEKVSIHRTS